MINEAERYPDVRAGHCGWAVHWGDLGTFRNGLASQNDCRPRQDSGKIAAVAVAT